MSLANTSMLRRCGVGSTPSSSGGSYSFVHGDLTNAGGEQARCACGDSELGDQGSGTCALGSPVRVAVPVVVAEQVGIPLGILGQLQGLVDRVQQVVGQVRHEVDQLCAAWPDGSSSRVAVQSRTSGPAACVLLAIYVLVVVQRRTLQRRLHPRRWHPPHQVQRGQQPRIGLISDMDMAVISDMDIGVVREEGMRTAIACRGRGGAGGEQGLKGGRGGKALRV